MAIQESCVTEPHFALTGSPPVHNCEKNFTIPRLTIIEALDQVQVFLAVKRSRRTRPKRFGKGHIVLSIVYTRISIFRGAPNHALSIKME